MSHCRSWVSAKWVEFSSALRHRVEATPRPRMSTQHVRSHAWHPMSTPVRYCYAGGFALGAGLGLFFARAGDGGWPLFFIGGLFAFASFGMATDQQTRIDPVAGTVTREGQLLGLVLVWRRQRPLSDFSAVGFQRTHGAEGGDSIFVGLQPKRGRFVAVRYFNTGSGQRCDQAVDFACQLAGDTRLQVVRENDA